MPRVSQNLITSEMKKEILEFFEETLTLLNSRDKTVGFLRHFFTPEERIMLAKRLAIGILLLEGWHYASVCRLLKVSATTVRGIKNKLEESEEYKKFVLPVWEKKKSDAKLKKLDAWLSAVQLPMKGSRSDMQRWKRAMKNI